MKLQNGLIAIGGLEGEGKSSVCLKLANDLAKTENVLLISYQQYKEKLERLIENFDGSMSENLLIYTDFEYFGVGAFVELMQLLESNPISTVFIDNSDFLNKYDPWDTAYGDVDEFVNAMAFLASHFNIRLVFTVNIAQKTTITRKHPMLKDFNSSRHIANKCDQVLSIYRPFYYGFTEDANGEPINKNQIDIYDLKNKHHKTLVSPFQWIS
ncbi:MAG: hypothetical protein PF590_09080 [Candidatus Delongbacteria bacterium]|jgi:replicative DNA helicase|nr:hypothetical protein [Candidatus Delongbacteria bacterium]